MEAMDAPNTPVAIHRASAAKGNERGGKKGVTSNECGLFVSFVELSQILIYGCALVAVVVVVARTRTHIHTHTHNTHTYTAQHTHTHTTQHNTHTHTHTHTHTPKQKKTHSTRETSA